MTLRNTIYEINFTFIIILTNVFSLFFFKLIYYSFYSVIIFIVLDAIILEGEFAAFGDSDSRFDVLLQLETFQIRVTSQCLIECARHALCNSYHVTSNTCELTYIVMACKHNLSSTTEIGTNFYIHENS